MVGWFELFAVPSCHLRYPRSQLRACCRLSRLNIIIIDGLFKYKCISRRHFKPTKVKKSNNAKPLARNVMADVMYTPSVSSVCGFGGKNKEIRDFI